MRDRIHIKKLVLPTVVGVPEEERELPQSVTVSATLFLREDSFRGVTDDLAHSVDYYEISRTMRKVAVARDRRLIETLAEDLAGAILKFDGVETVHLEVEKLILPNCQAVSVEIERSQV